MIVGAAQAAAVEERKAIAPIIEEHRAISTSKCRIDGLHELRLKYVANFLIYS